MSFLVVIVVRVLLPIFLLVMALFCFAMAIRSLAGLLFPEWDRRQREDWLNTRIFETFVDEDGKMVYLKTRREKIEYYEKRRAKKAEHRKGYYRSLWKHMA